MAGFGDLILNMMGKEDPRAQVLAAMGGTPTGGAAYAQPAAAPAGTDAPAATQQQPVAQAYTSPPQLLELYTKLQDRERSNSMIDRGIGMIGASLAFPENRAGIMDAFGGGSSGGGGSGAASMIDQVMKVQQMNQNIQQMAATRMALPGIAKRYGLDLPTAQYLLQSGKLDSVIAEAEKPNKQIVSNADGTSSIVDISTGTIGEAFGPKKQREIEIITSDTGDQFPVWKDTGQRVGTDNIVTGEGSTAEIRDLNRANKDREAKDLPPLSMEEFKKLGGNSGAGKAVDAAGNPLPDLPKDSAWVRNPDGTVKMENGIPQVAPIGGSDLQRERSADRTKADNKKAARSVQQTVVNDKIDEALRISENENGWLPTTGIGGQVLSGYGSTAAHDLKTTLDTVKSNLGFDKLQEMRENSPTGGALGAISDFENKLLQSTLTSLEQSQSKEQFQRNLRKLKSTLEIIINIGVDDPNENPAPALTGRDGQPVTPPADNGGFKIRSVR